MKALFHGSAEAGHEGTEEHGVFDAEPEAFGVLAKEGGGEVHKLRKAMFDTIKTLRMENVTRRARALHPDDARRWPYLQAAGRGIPQKRISVRTKRLPGGGTHHPSSETRHSGRAQVDEVEDDLISFRDPGHHPPDSTDIAGT